MPVAAIGPTDALPRAYCFVSFAHRQKIRTLRIRTSVLRVGLGLVSLAAAWLVGSSLYLFLHDDLVAALIAREAATQYAYEDRITALRGQVEHEVSAKLVNQTSLEGKLKELALRASALEARASVLAAIAGRTGLTAAATRGAGASATLPAASPEVVDPTDAPAGVIAAPKPHPEGEGSVVDNPQRSSAADGPAFNIRLAALEEQLEHVDATQVQSLGKVQAGARRRADALRDVIQSAGLSMERLAPRKAEEPLGGPFVPLDAAVLHSPFGQAIEMMQRDIAVAAGLAQVMPSVPLAKPLDGPLEVTSPYGARVDPFLGRPAMHTGVDLRESYGSSVHATAAGRVVTAGPVGGYGLMIEIDHGHGLATRYAHLSSVEVAPGQTIEDGAVIGEVGATGRATGPHLHYETRIDGEAVDPERFLVAGARFAALERGRQSAALP